jgi:mannose-6-phosphate isomerase-like protein (cupin superfamily)
MAPPTNEEAQMQVRRVVTGQTDDGTSVFASDEVVDPITLSLLPGAEFHRLWGADDVVQLPTDGRTADQALYFPPAHGFRFGYFSLAPDSQGLPPDLDISAALAEMGEKLPGMADVMERDDPGMHQTDTVDFLSIVSGEVVLELDDGAERLLRPGDCVIQNGARHAWRNRGTEPCVILVVLVGAQRTRVGT